MQLSHGAGVRSQSLGQGQHNLAVRDRKTDLFGHVQGGQQGAFLVAGYPVLRVGHVQRCLLCKAFGDRALPVDPAVAMVGSILFHAIRTARCTGSTEVPLEIPYQVAPHRRIDADTLQNRSQARRYLAAFVSATLTTRPIKQFQII